MNMTYAQKAALGMAVVNADLGEGWVDTFDLELFRMEDIWLCVLGQAYNKPGSLVTGFSRGLDALVGEGTSWQEREEYSRSHGFASPTEAGYRRLDKAWRTLISKQQARRDVAD